MSFLTDVKCSKITNIAISRLIGMTRMFYLKFCIASLLMFWVGEWDLVPIIISYSCYFTIFGIDQYVRKNRDDICNVLFDGNDITVGEYISSLNIKSGINHLS